MKGNIVDKQTSFKGLFVLHAGEVSLHYVFEGINSWQKN